MLGAATRFAGSALKGGGKLGKMLGKRIANTIGPIGPGEAAALFGPDLMFGALYAAQTPGDLTDKIIAGTGSAVGGIAGGVGLRGALGVKNPALGTVIDMAGSMGGDIAGQMTSDQILRAKDKLSGGQGLSPWEKMTLEQEMQMRQQIEQEVRQDIYQSLLSKGIY